MAGLNNNLNRRMRRRYVEIGRKVAYLHRRASRAELTPGQKVWLEAAEAELRKLARFASTG